MANDTNTPSKTDEYDQLALKAMAGDADAAEQLERLERLIVEQELAAKRIEAAHRARAVSLGITPDELNTRIAADAAQAERDRVAAQKQARHEHSERKAKAEAAAVRLDDAARMFAEAAAELIEAIPRGPISIPGTNLNEAIFVRPQIRIVGSLKAALYRALRDPYRQIMAREIGFPSADVRREAAIATGDLGVVTRTFIDESRDDLTHYRFADKVGEVTKVVSSE